MVGAAPPCAGSAMLNAAIVTTCKGRIDYLKQCLPSWLDQDVGPLVRFSIVVVDYGCPDKTADWIELSDWTDSLARPVGVHAIRVGRDTEFFNQSRARNIGMRRAVAAGANVLASVDADVILKPHFLRQHIGAMLQHNWELCKVATDAGNGGLCFVGTSVFTSRLFEQVRGYDESLQRYGHDDTDFYWRSERAAPGRVGHLPSDCTHLPNSNEERLRFFREKDFQASIDANLAVAMNRERVVNAGEWGRP